MSAGVSGGKQECVASESESVLQGRERKLKTLLWGRAVASASCQVSDFFVAHEMGGSWESFRAWIILCAIRDRQNLGNCRLL